ncbi:hypothetical protein [Virgisporangium aurantiacum]|uniref:Yip1 domain-containing protein n=1 Tax=Virgisporangium aurantiacum TaxID=175570 RepID=A0A8J4DZD4_9ACTN|nr:hypothetical protein [Virgisporangium aurantiacum]GIJ56605.1 hypothetical protein Vau01_041210 [Virgisporangium aurantiacum]
MSGWLARLVVRTAAALVGGPEVRARYREQWLADVEGAREVGLRPAAVAAGAAVAAARLAVTRPRWQVTPLGWVTTAVRRRYLVVQLAVAYPYAWALGYLGYARVRSGLTVAQLFDRPVDPKDLLVPWLPTMWLQPLVMLWLAVGGWVVGAALAPVGLALSIGGRGSSRWLPVAGTLTAAVVTAFAVGDLGAGLRLWLLD